MATLLDEPYRPLNATQAYPVVVSASDALLGQVVPVTFGMAFPRGEMRDAAVGRLLNEHGDRSTAQCRVTSRWGDGSVRWLLIDAATPVISAVNAEWQFVPTEERHCPCTGNRACIRAEGQELTIEFVNREQQSKVESAVSIQSEILGESGVAESIAWSDAREVESGVVCGTFVVRGHLLSIPDVRIQLRLTVWPDHGFVKLASRIRNSRRARHPGGLWDLGDPGSYRFREFRHRVRLVGEASTMTDVDNLILSVHPDVEERMCDPEVDIRLTQFSSGQRNWMSSTHMNHEGRVNLVRRGYELRTGDHTEHGHIAQPVMSLSAGGLRLAVAVSEFWQQFPSALDYRHGELGVGLFPKIDGQTYELQGGEQKTLTTWVSICPTRTGDTLAPLAWVAHPVRVIQSPGAFALSEVFDWFCGDFDSSVDLRDSGRESCQSDDHGARPNSQRFGPEVTRLQRFLRDTLTGERSLAERRRAIDEYGWRNFGDIHADHEQQHFAGSETVVSHYNNQFDSVLGGILQMAASGNADWFQFFDPLARHVADIDIYHTQQDRAAYNGGLFWHTDHYVDAATATHRTYSRANGAAGRNGGGPCAEHNYTTGLLHHYYLTGDENSRESVCTLADWVIAMEDGSSTIHGILDDGPTGLATATVDVSYHGPGRAGGNSINALLDAWLLTGDVRYQQFLEDLIRRCVHPAQDLDALQLLHAETHWSYTIFLTALGRYLRAKLDAGENDAMYSYAWHTMQHYGRWMVRNERPSLDRPEELHYVTDAWAAQEFRKANVLRIASLCENDDEWRHQMRSKGNELNEAAWQGLVSFDGQHRNARCLAILMTEGLRDISHRRDLSPQLPAPTVDYPASEWVHFVPQCVRVRQLLRSPVALLKSLPLLASPWRWGRFAKSPGKSR